MGEGKIKFGDLEGSKDDVLDFMKESGADIPSLLNASKDVKIPFWSIVISTILFLILAIVLAVCVLEEPVYKALSLLCIAVGVILVALIYMAYKSKCLTGIIAMGEVILLSVSLGLYSPREMVEKIGEKLEDIIRK